MVRTHEGRDARETSCEGERGWADMKKEERCSVDMREETGIKGDEHHAVKSFSSSLTRHHPQNT
jgi:hypothetical protein